MTKEGAKRFGLQLLHGIMERNGSYPVYANNVKQAIEALSEPNGSSEIPNDLEEAARKHSCYDEDCEGAWYEPIVRNAFIAGAEWQKEQDLAEMAQSKSPLSVAYANRCFENGKQAMKEKLMKEAVECYYGYVNNCTKVFLPEETLKGVKEGYVRIVILKNDE